MSQLMLKSGTILKKNGIPMILLEDTFVEANEANHKLILDELPHLAGDNQQE